MGEGLEIIGRVAALVGIVGAIFLGARWLQRRTSRVIEDVAETFGLTVTHASGAMVGHVDGFVVAVEAVYVDGSVEAWKLEVLTPELEGLVELRPFGLAKLADRVTGGGIELGVPELARRVSARGEALEVLARLDTPAREAALATIAKGRARVEGGRIHVEIPWAFRSDDVIGQLRALLDLARHLQLPAGTTAADRVLELATGDPAPGFRRACLEALVASASQTAAGREAARILREHPEGGLSFAPRAAGELSTSPADGSMALG